MDYDGRCCLLSLSIFKPLAHQTTAQNIHRSINPNYVSPLHHYNRLVPIAGYDYVERSIFPGTRSIRLRLALTLTEDEFV